MIEKFNNNYVLGATININFETIHCYLLLFNIHKKYTYNITIYVHIIKNKVCSIF